MLSEFLNNWIFDKNVKFDFKKKEYNFPLISDPLSISNNYFKSIIDDKTISSVEISENENNQPGIYFINLRFLNFDSFINILVDELQVILKKDKFYKWNYEKTNKLYVLLINNINKIDKDEYVKLSNFTTILNNQKEYNNKFIIIDKQRNKLYEFYNLYFINKSEIEDVISSELFDNIIDQIMSVIESMNLKTEIYLEIHNIILCKLYKLVILEIAKDKSKQNFKENVINPFIKWLFNKNDISEFIKIKDIKELKQILITNIIKLLFDSKNKNILEDTILFNDLIIVNDSDKENKNYEYQLSNYKYYNSNNFIKVNDKEYKTAIIMLNIY